MRLSSPSLLFNNNKKNCIISGNNTLICLCQESRNRMLTKFLHYLLYDFLKEKLHLGICSTCGRTDVNLVSRAAPSLSGVPAVIETIVTMTRRLTFAIRWSWLVYVTFSKGRRSIHYLLVRIKCNSN